MSRQWHFSPDGKTLVGGGWDYTIQLWDVATGQHRTTLEGHMDRVHSVAFSPDGKTLVSGGWDKTVPVVGYRHPFRCVMFSPDIHQLFHLLHFHPMEKPSQVQVMTRQFAYGRQIQENCAQRFGSIQVGVDRIIFSPNGETLASSSYDDETIRLWKTDTGEQRTTITGHWRLGTAAFSPDKRTIAIASEPESIWLWDVVTDQKLATLAGHTRDVTALAFSPNGSTLASGSWDKTVRFWDVPTGKLRVTLEGHSDMVNTISFSPDGKILASGGNANRLIYLWNTETGTRRSTLNPDTTGHIISVFARRSNPCRRRR